MGKIAPGALRRLGQRLRTGAFALRHGPALLRMRGALAQVERLLAEDDLRTVLARLGEAGPLMGRTEPGEAVRLVQLATRLWSGPRNTCLRQALLLYRVLRGWGLEAEFAVAAGLGEGELAAHAWVSLDGRDLLPGCPAGQKELWRHRGGRAEG